MTTLAQKKRRRLIQMAEGYLGLAVMFEDCWALDPTHCRKLASRTIACLNEIENPAGYQSHILFLKGQAHRIAGRVHQATHFFQQSSRTDPENLNCLLALAWCYKRTGQLELAIGALENAVQIDASSAIAHYNLACYWALAKNTGQAVLHLSTAIELDAEYRDLMVAEPDFDSIRDTSGFQHLFEVNA